MKPHNMHVHTNWSDGKYGPEYLAEMGRQKGLRTIGFSDHAFSEKLSHDRQVTNNIEKYIDRLKELKSGSKDIQIKIGMEIDVSKDWGIRPSLLPFEIINELDYVLFEYVDTDYEIWGKVGKRSIYEIVGIMKRLDVPAGLAHNDMQKNYKSREAEIAGILSVNDIFVELNCGENIPSTKIKRNSRDGKYYFEHFSEKLIDELSRKDVKFVAGTDCHNYAESIAETNSAYNFAIRNNLQWHSLAE